MRDQQAFLQQLFALDEVLGRKGFPRFSPRWREILTDFYLSGKRQAVIRKGRRVGASTIVGARVAVCEALHGQHRFSPGDRAVFAFVSVKREEAAKRIRNVEVVLDALGVAYDTSGDVIALRDYRIDIAVSTASFRTAVGDTCVGVWCDELTRWQDASTGANPATEVLASIRPTIATLPDARMWLVSSPLGNADAHAKAFDRGDDEFQRVYHGATWELNPTLTEEMTRALEPDERVWRREYAAIPQEAVMCAFDLDSVEKAMRTAPRDGRWGRPIMSIDPSSGRGDAFVSVLCSWREKVLGNPVDQFHREVDEFGQDVTGVFLRDGHKLVRDAAGNPIIRPDADLSSFKPMAVFRDMCAVEGKFFGLTPLEHIVDDISDRAFRAGTRVIVSDQREELALESAFRSNSMQFNPIPWTNERKVQAVARLRRLLAEGSVVLPQDRDLRRELLGYSEKISETGTIQYSGRGTGKDDRVAVLLTAMMAEVEGLLWSPATARKHGACVSMPHEALG